MDRGADKPASLYYTQREVAEMFRVSQGTVIKWRELGYLEYFRPPGSNRVTYSVDGVERFRKNFTYRKEVMQKPPATGSSYRRVAPANDWRI
ncbi:MAG: helix-turn-helix domain-containing protein [Desulfobacteraceae bacterium]|nr:helix-turn-helix domain-containing protein [Desulfobacteraceae bacterium]MBC2750103.1 helix-turn-helix domain-containing protein [Desulfobacteraceae bacterium]